MAPVARAVYPDSGSESDSWHEDDIRIRHRRRERRQPEFLVAPPPPPRARARSQGAQARGDIYVVQEVHDRARSQSRHQQDIGLEVPRQHRRPRSRSQSRRASSPSEHETLERMRWEYQREMELRGRDDEIRRLREDRIRLTDQGELDRVEMQADWYRRRLHTIDNQESSKRQVEDALNAERTKRLQEQERERAEEKRLRQKIEAEQAKQEAEEAERRKKEEEIRKEAIKEHQRLLDEQERKAREAKEKLDKEVELRIKEKERVLLEKEAKAREEKERQEKEIEIRLRERLLAAGHTEEQIISILKQKSGGKQTYIRVHRHHIMPETLDYFQLPWEWDDRDADYIVIKRWINEEFQDELFEHTRVLRGQRLLVAPSHETVTKLKVNDEDRDKMYLVRKRSPRPRPRSWFLT